VTGRVVAGIVVAGAAVLTLVTMGRAAGMLVVAMIASYGVWVARSRWPQGSRILPAYAAAVLIQCAHLVEEYRGDFHRLFPPVFGADPWSGRRFLIFNLVWLGVFVPAGFGLARGNRESYLVALFLALGGGIGNGLGHLALAVRERGYFPGVYTGIFALLAGSALIHRLFRPRAEA